MNASSVTVRCLCIPVVVITAASIALFVFVAFPLREKISVESDDIQKFHAKTEYAERKIARLPEIEAQFGIVKEDERKLSLLLSEEQVVTFIEKIEELARAVDGEVTIAQGSALDVTKKKQPVKDPGEGDAIAKEKAAPDTIADNLPWEKRLPLRITFTGEYKKAVNFLHKVESMPYRLDVVSIGVQPVTPEDGIMRESSFISIPTPEGEVLPVVPVEPEKPLVTTIFDLLIYMN